MGALELHHQLFGVCTSASRLVLGHGPPEDGAERLAGCDRLFPLEDPVSQVRYGQRLGSNPRLVNGELND